MTKPKRLNLRVAEDVYDFIVELAEIFECSKSEAISKVLVLAQVVYHSELKDLLVLLAKGYDIDFGVDAENEESKPT